MESILVTTIIIVIIISYIIYRFKTIKKVYFCLDKGGKFENGLFKPDFQRDDLRKLLSDCEKIKISSEIAKGFLISTYNKILWQFEPEAFNLQDNRYELWDLDEEIEDIINFLFANYKIKEIKWNDDDILNLVTFQDLLLYLNQKFANQSFNGDSLKLSS